MCAYTIMDLIKFIIIAIIFVILLGCVFLSNTESIANYFSSTTIAAHNRYDIQFIDDNDVNYIKWAFPGIRLPNTFDKTSTPITTLTNPLIPGVTSGIYDSGSVQYDQETITTNNQIKSQKCPNMPIPDEELGLSLSTTRDFGIELPWDREIGFCEVLKGTDRDLYKSVQDATNITFY